MMCLLHQYALLSREEKNKAVEEDNIARTERDEGNRTLQPDVNNKNTTYLEQVILVVYSY